MQQILSAVTICSIAVSAYEGRCAGCEEEKDYDDPIKCQNYVTQNPSNDEGCTGWDPQSEYLEALAKQSSHKTGHKSPDIKSCPDALFQSINGICVGCEHLGIQDELLCTKYISMGNKEGCKEWMPLDDDGHKTKTKTKKTSASEVKIHARTPDHCAYTALYSIAQNQLNGGVKWTPKIWNRNAEDVDEIYKLEDDQKMHRATYHFKRYWSGKGAFSKVIEQMMLRTVGLNFGSSSVDNPYPPMIANSKPEFQEHYLETKTGNDRGAKHKLDKKKYAKYRALLQGANDYYINSKGKASSMVGMVIGINACPYQKYKNNHNAALFQWIDKNFYYIDTNVHEIQTLEQFNNEGYKMCNVYDGKSIKNGAKRAKKKFANGYLVDHSLNLGTDIDAVTHWLYDKLEIRPRWFEEHGAETGTTAATTDSGGAFFYRVVVKDDVIQWEKMLEFSRKYVETGDVKQAEAVLSTARMIIDNYYEDYGNDEGDDYVEREKHDYFDHFGFNSHYKQQSNLIIMGEIITLNVLIILLLWTCFGICGGIIGYMLYHYVHKQ